MREIYSLAQEVLVWLGSGDRDTVAAIAACQDIMLSIQSVIRLSGFDFEALGVTNPDPWSGF
jgi:Icc-related predicted phosphoesterase